MGIKKTTETFIEEAMKIHGDKYDYSKSVYVTSTTKLIIICNEHGEFTQNPNNHVNNKQSCPQCAKIRLPSKSTSQFILEARKIHGNKYDYSKANYVTNRIKLIIICNEHGEFVQAPLQHIYKRSGCPKCSCKKHFRNTTENFILISKQIHANNYDYRKVQYVSAIEPVIIICRIHGEFTQKPSYHLSGNGCPKCGKHRIGCSRKSNKEEFIKKASKIHNGIYDYSNLEYIDAITKSNIICPKGHNFYQSPHEHLSGHGCPMCHFTGYSKPQIEWLTFLENMLGIKINHIGNIGEHRIKNSRYRADGFCDDYYTIFEFNGCYFHGCQICNKHKNKICHVNGKHSSELYKLTEKKKEHCLKQGYNYISIWECEWKKIQKSSDEEKKYIKFIKTIMGI